MKRTVIAVAAGLIVTVVACVVLLNSRIDNAPVDRGVVWAVSLGGLLGSLVAGASAGAQVAYLNKNPKSNASLAAMVVGFFAKLTILTAGILVLHVVNSSWSPTGFGVAFFLVSALVSAITLSSMAKTFGP